MKQNDDEMFRTFSFKGIPIEPLSYGRRTFLLGLCNLSNPTFADVPTFIYGCICDIKEVLHARRNPAAFDAAVMRWVEEIKYDTDDLTEANEVIKAILDHTEIGKVVPSRDNEDLSIQSDPLGN